MTKFNVTIREIEIYTFEDIEADDEQEAQDKAWELLLEGGESAKLNYHDDSDGESEAYEASEF